MSAIQLHAKFHRPNAQWEIRRIHDQINRRHLLAAAPDSNFVVHEINPRAAINHFIRAQQFHQPLAHLYFALLDWQIDAASIRGQTLPVALEGKRLSFVNADRREQAPAVQ